VGRTSWAGKPKRSAAALVVSALLVTAISVSSSAAPPASAFALMANWIQLSPATSPPPRTAAALAYDPATGNTVLFGGDEVTGGSGTMLSDTWTWDGSTWTEQFPAVSPPARYGASMAYDSATGDLVLFGGLSANGDMSDTWTWDGSTWTQQLPKTSPPARYTSSMAYDDETGNVVLFGGLAGRTVEADTWTWNGTTWTQLFPSTKPPARDAASMSYDAASQDMVLFGGNNGGATNLSDTWTWNGTTWAVRTSTSSPSGRYGASMAYDPATSNVILFGGYGGGQNDLADMWAWNGTAWTEQFPAASPTARRYAAMDYDAMSGSIVLFGGDPGGVTPSSLADTWIWGSEGQFTSSPASASIMLGSTNTDTATVTGNVGAGPPTGTVTFYTCGPTAGPTPCAAQAVELGGAETLTQTGDDAATATSPVFTPPVAGTWCFAVAYSGDTDYAPVTDTTDGCFVVHPTIATAPALSSIVLGNSDTDGATVFGTTTGSPTGSVTFYACGPTATPSPCTSQGEPVGGPVTVTAAGENMATATSPSFTPTAVGDWCFAGYYGGDGNYAPGSDTTTDECFTVISDFSTTPNQTTIGLGASDSDTGTVVGNPTGGLPTGTVTFYACGPTATPTPCTSQADLVGSPVPVTVNAGDTATATSPAFTPTAVGDWCFAGYYGGDGNYASNSDTSTGECFDVVAVAPVFTSVASASGTAKQPFTFTVTTTGGPTPSITKSALPTWLTLVDNHDGTATLQATKARRGKHRFVLTATNSAGSVTQIFTLTVRKAGAV
jgi:hypothetical protein